MSLAPREQERLAAIENQFRATDPGFARMFRVAGKPGRRGKGRIWVLLSVWVARQGGTSALVLIATILTLVTTCAAVIAVLA